MAQHKKCELCNDSGEIYTETEFGAFVDTCSDCFNRNFYVKLKQNCEEIKYYEQRIKAAAAVDFAWEISR